MRIFRINFELRLTRFKPAIERLQLSVNNRLCNNMTLHNQYNRKNIGIDNNTSTGTCVTTVYCFFKFILIK